MINFILHIIKDAQYYNIEFFMSDSNIVRIKNPFYPTLKQWMQLDWGDEINLMNHQEKIWKQG